MPLHISNPKARAYFDYLSRINATAYRCRYLTANPVLSKHPWRGRFFAAFMEDMPSPKIRLAFLLKKIVQYYLKNLFFFIMFLAKFLAFALSGQKWLPEGDQTAGLTMVGVYFVLSRILAQGQFQDSYFPGLYDVLEKQGLPYVFCPCFDGENPVRLYRTLRILKKQKAPVLTEYQTLKFSDCLRLLVFVIAYPFCLIRLIRNLGGTKHDRLLAWALWDDFDAVLVSVYARYLYGRKLAETMGDRIRFIAWYENQVVDKMLFRGLHRRPGRVKIYGAQLFIRSETELYTIPDDTESVFGALPDIILVNGPNDLPESSRIPFRTGPSFRYRPLFAFDPANRKPEKIVVLLPYYDPEIRAVLTAVKGAVFPDPVVIKFHPSTSRERYEEYLTGQVEISTLPLYELLKTAKVVIGSATGALVEAASLGVPVIVIKNQEGFTHQFLPQNGKGIIWGEADGPETLRAVVEYLSRTEAGNSSIVRERAEQYKKAFFREPTEAAIVQAFDL